MGCYLHVLFQLVASLQVVNVSLDGHVVQAEKIIKDDTEMLL